MQCEKFENRLHELLDERQRPESDPALQAHAAHCAACRATFLACEKLLTGLELHEAPELPDNFAQRVVAEALVADSSPITPAPSVNASTLHSFGSTRGFAWQVASWSVAAGVLIAVGLLTFRPQGAPSVSDLPVPSVDAPTETVQVTVATDPNPNLTLGQDFASNPQDSLVDHPAPLQPLENDTLPREPFRGALPAEELALLVESADGLFDGRNTGRMIREVTSSLPEVPIVEEHIPGLRPLTSGLSLTIGLVRKTLPGGREAPPRLPEKSAPPPKPQAELLRDPARSIFS